MNLKFHLAPIKIFIIVIFFFIIEFLFLKETPFFWDAVSKSVRAKWFYDTNFSQFVLPLDLNSGHPPLWPMLLAGWWKIFGMTLISSRFLLLIINILVGYQLIILFKNNISKNQSWVFIFILFLEPTLLAQNTILNNDMLMLLFTLLTYNIIAYSKEKKEFLLTLALTGILFSNLRGMLLFSCLLILNLLFVNYKLNFKKFNYKPFLIAFIFFSIFLIYQYSILGWIIKTPSPNWAAQREVSSFPNILKNIAAIVRNFLDFGRVVIIGITLYLVFLYFKKNTFLSNTTVAKLLISIIVFSLGMSIFFMFFTNPIGHRYFMISYLLIIVLFLVLMNLFKNSIYNKSIYVLVIVAFITGHFWIYPSTIAQGWDSSLAYLKYFKLRDNIELFVKENNIEKELIGTNLPLNEKEYSDLEPVLDKHRYSNLDVVNNEYIILSNIENETSDDDINLIRNNWILIKKCSNLGVYVNLYKNPN